MNSKIHCYTEKSVGSRSLGGSSTWGRLGLEGLLIFVSSTLFSSGSITTWRVAERFFSEFFSFLFDNTSWCYLVFVFLFPTLKLYFILLIMDEYGLEQCYWLFAHIYSYSALSLSQSRSNLAVILIWESKQTLVFPHKFELS